MSEWYYNADSARLSFSYDAICKNCGRRQSFNGCMKATEGIKEYYIDFICKNRKCKKRNRYCFEMGVNNIGLINGAYINI